MPIYFGCTAIESFFPAEAMIRIDLDDPDGAAHTIADAVATDRWSQNLDAIAEARRRCLEQYQLFPFIADIIAQKPPPQPQRVRKVKLNNHITLAARASWYSYCLRTAFSRLDRD